MQAPLGRPPSLAHRNTAGSGMHACAFWTSPVVQVTWHTRCDAGNDTWDEGGRGSSRRRRVRSSGATHAPLTRQRVRVRHGGRPGRPRRRAHQPLREQVPQRCRQAPPAIPLQHFVGPCLLRNALPCLAAFLSDAVTHCGSCQRHCIHHTLPTQHYKKLQLQDVNHHKCPT